MRIYDFNQMIERIKKIKKEKKLTNAQLAELAQLPYGTLNKILGSETKTPTIESILKISETLGVSADYIIYGEIPTSPTQPNELPLTPHEKTVMTAYRDQPEMRPAVDKLLGVKEEKLHTIKIAARNGKFEEKTMTDSELDAFKASIDALPPIDAEF